MTLRVPGSPYLLIGLASALMLAAVFVTGEAIFESNESAALPLTGAGDTPSIPTEAGVSRLARIGLEYRDTPATPASGRSLDTFYSRRAYPGAPPVIPHPLADPTSFGGQTCLACHGDGGWVPKLNAFAPVTPHPELVSCVQCHVDTAGRSLFRRTRFEPDVRPAINRSVLPGSPPAIPHDLTMRDNCLACHGGPAAVKEIRTAHPERVNCRQCHAAGAPTTATPVFRRTVGRRP